MFEKFIKKDKNEELERILDEKEISEQAKNLLQGILYKIEVSYKDYKKAKSTEITEAQYVEELLKTIQKKCRKIQTIKLSQKIENKKIQEEIEKNKFYINENEIICYPIEKKILYAIQKNSNNNQIVNNKYEIVKMSLSNIINTGRNIDRLEVLRDFNGWSWTTIKTEIENIKANLVYQTIRILLGEEFLNDWSKDTDGIIDYIKIMTQELEKKFGSELTEEFKKRLFQLAIINEIEENAEYKMNMIQKLEEVRCEFDKYSNTKEYIKNITDRKKELEKEIKEIETILSQEEKIKEEYKRINSTLSNENKIFSIRILKQKLNENKQELLKQIEKCNYLLNPANYLKEKQIMEQNKQLYEVIDYNNQEKENVTIEFERIFLQCLKKIILSATSVEEISNLIYKVRYFMVLPFNIEKSIKNVNELQEDIIEVEKELMKVAIEKRVITDVPFEVMEHVFQTRIVILEELYFMITEEENKYYVQLFDENITEEKFEVQPIIDKTKINKKIKIFI